MHDDNTQDQLTIQLGQALKETFSQVEELERLTDTLKEEAKALRNQQEGLEEALVEAREKGHSTISHTSLEDQKQAFKKQQSKVAHVLKKTLEALKTSREENTRFTGIPEALQAALEENRQLSENLKRLKVEFQTYVKNLQAKSEAEASGAAKKLQEMQVQLRDQSKLIGVMKETIEKKEAVILQKKLHEEKVSRETAQDMAALQQELKEWQEKYYTAQVRLNKSEAALSEFHHMKTEYERMQSLFGNIKSFMGIPSEENVP